MKGYFTPYGYMGLVGDRYIQFATDGDYYDYIGDRSSGSSQSNESVTELVHMTEFMPPETTNLSAWMTRVY